MGVEENMGTRIMGLIVIGDLVCDGCGSAMRHPERYAFVYDEDNGTESRFCEKCSREKGYLKTKTSEWGEEIETFL